MSFTDWRRSQIDFIAKNNDIIVEHNLQFEWQHLIRFLSEKEECKLRIWYNGHFYNGIQEITSSTSKDFSALCISICEESLFTKEIPFNAKFQFQNLLHKYIYEITSSLEICVTNIVQKEWNDIYYFKTKASCSYIEFYFNSKGIYSVAIPKSSDGIDDIILKSIIEKLKNN